MRFTALLFIVASFAGCATHRDDERLQGTWISNRDATIAAAFQRDPHWTNAQPEKVERFSDTFSHMAVTYSHGAEVVWGGEAWYGVSAVSFHYHVAERGSNYIVIRSTAPMDKGQDIRIRFVDGGKGYWIDTGSLGLGIQERFDKIQPKPMPLGSGGVIASTPIPLDL